MNVKAIRAKMALNVRTLPAITLASVLVDGLVEKTAIKVTLRR